MKQGQGKNKGGDFERKVCSALSLWVSGGAKRDVFWRSSMSGGRATVARRKGDLVRQAGDICAVAVEGHVFTDRYYIECKHYRDLQLARFVLMEQGVLAKFWRNTQKEARRYRRRPLMIVRQNNMPILLLSEFDDGFLSGLCPTSICTICSMARVFFFENLIEYDFDRGRIHRERLNVGVQS